MTEKPGGHAACGFHQQTAEMLKHHMPRSLLCIKFVSALYTTSAHAPRKGAGESSQCKRSGISKKASVRSSLIRTLAAHNAL